MRLKNPFLVKFAGRLAGRALVLLFKTIRHDVYVPPNVRPYLNSGPEQFIFAVWHDAAALATFGGKHIRTVALMSRHRDGSFVEEVMATANVGAIRGSSRRGGAAAVLQMIKTSKDHDIVITPDGPRGPRRTMTHGIVYAASRTGNPMVPTAFACSNAWEVPGSWTTLTIPKPFSRVVFVAGDGIDVPAGLERDEIEEYRVRMQTAMDALQDEADRLAADSSDKRSPAFSPTGPLRLAETHAA